MHRIVFILCAGFVLCTPLLVSAQLPANPLVPCDGVDIECQACHAVELGQNILNFLVYIAAFIAVMLFAYAGFLMVTAAGNMSQVEKAKGIFTNVLIGIIIVLVGWLVVDTVMKWAFEGSVLDTDTNREFGPWNSIQCVEQPSLRNPNPGQGRPTVGGGTDKPLSVTDAAGRIGATEGYVDELCSYADAEGVAGQCAHLQAIMAIESNGNPRAVSPVGAVGLMQVMPSTARTLDPSLRRLSDAEVIEYLKDPTNNMKLGVELYARDYKYYNGDLTLVAAAFNGGRGANGDSRDCPGLRRWECEWDNQAHTIPNTGYRETRNYVVNVERVMNQITDQTPTFIP